MKGISHPHPDLVRQAHDTALPSRERKIREWVAHMEREPGRKVACRPLPILLKRGRADEFGHSEPDS
jgi:hypothetical protein